MRIITFIVVFLVAHLSFGGDFQKGLEALHEKQYSKAIGYFTQASEQEPMNVSTWNNLGISYFKMRKYGHAIHAFQMASKLDPSDNRPLESIELCYQKLESNVRLDEAYSSTQKVAYQIGGFKLNILSMVFSILFAFFIFKVLKKNQGMRNIYLILAIPALFFMTVSIFLSIKASTYISSVRNAVVVQPKAMLYINEMGKLSDEVLSEGSSVEIQDNKDGFYEIKGSVGQTLYLRKVDCKVY